MNKIIEKRSKTIGNIYGHNFYWPDGHIGDISDSNLIRFSIKGKHDTYIAFAEENKDTAKKITYVIGGWYGKKCGVHWMPEGRKGNDDWFRSPQ